MSTDLVRTDMAPLDVMTIGKMLAQSGYFQDAKDAAQAVVKVLAGQEMGIGPVAAMTGIYIVKGRVTLSANLMAAQIKRSGRYNYRVTQLDDSGCEIVFFEGTSEIGRSSFTAEDAQRAGLWNSSEPWKKTPRNMMFARAMSNGAKWYCPEVFSGPVYTPDELEESAPSPATEKQRHYISGLMDKLDWTSEQLSAYADEQRVDLVTMTQDQASSFIGGMKALVEERSRPVVVAEPVRQITTHAPEALAEIDRLKRDVKALRDCERAIGLPPTDFKWNAKQGIQPLKDELKASRARLEEYAPGLVTQAQSYIEEGNPVSDEDRAQLARYADLNVEMLSHADLIDTMTWVFNFMQVEEGEVLEQEPAL